MTFFKHMQRLEKDVDEDKNTNEDINKSIDIDNV